MDWLSGSVMECAQTCEDDQAVGFISVSDLAASEQHVVQVQRVALPVPLHRPCELVQAVVRFFTLYQGFGGKARGYEKVSVIKRLETLE